MQSTSFGGLYRPTFDDVGATLLFQKTISSLDLTHPERLTLPKAHAALHFPGAQTAPVDTTCQDTLGNQHNLRITSHVENKSRVYIVEGAETLLAAYSMVAGDSLCFGQLPGSELVACGRRPHSEESRGSDKILVTIDRGKRKRGRPRKHPLPEPQSLRQTHTRPKVPAMTRQSQLVNRAVTDGIFRETDEKCASEGQYNVVQESEHWTVVMSCSGQSYKAAFPTKEAACEACLAIGSKY